MQLLKLSALDADDLEVISAHMQDALLTVGDLRYVSRHQKFALVASRFNRLADDGERRQCGLQFGRVTKARSKKIRRGAPDAVLSLLSIGFKPTDVPPAGIIELVFSGGGAIELECECIEAALSDLGPARPTEAVPSHDTGSGE